VVGLFLWRLFTWRHSQRFTILTTMAPLFISCDTLARTRAYSPLNRGLVKANSPGCRTRVVPFVRLTRSIPHISCGAASQELHNVQAQSNNNNGDVGHAYQAGTLSVHGGEMNGRPKVADSLTCPIVQTATYTFENTQQLIDYQEGNFGSYEYGRYGNPTVKVLEDKIKALEVAEDCLVSSSGMNAACTMLLSLVPKGGHIVTTTDCYRRTRQFIQTFLPKMDIGATVIDPADLGALERALEEHDVSLFFSESPTNPYLRCVDIPAIKALCGPKNAAVVIDSTFATPINQKAIELGADLVIHSATKYLGGHQDVLAGAIAGRADLVAEVRRMHHILGGTIDPHAAYLVLRGMKTLDVRVERQNATAMEIARRLEAHPKISWVHYPGLESHPDHAIAKAQMTGFGGVISFEVDGDLWRTAALVDAVRLPYIAPSLGGVESLIEQPTVVSYWDQGPEKRAEIGIKDNLIRFSCGIEPMEDIWADLAQALDQI
jgi:cystathionine gamma-synthase